MQEKSRLKEEKEAAEAKYKVASVDGKKEKVCTPRSVPSLGLPMQHLLHCSVASSDRPPFMRNVKQSLPVLVQHPPSIKVQSAGYAAAVDCTIGLQNRFAEQHWGTGGRLTN